MSQFGQLASAKSIVAVRDFFRRHDDAYIASYIGKVAGLSPSDTLAAIVTLIDLGEVSVRVSDGGLCWTFTCRKHA